MGLKKRKKLDNQKSKLQLSNSSSKTYVPILFINNKNSVFKKQEDYSSSDDDEGLSKRKKKQKKSPAAGVTLLEHVPNKVANTKNPFIKPQKMFKPFRFEKIESLRVSNKFVKPIKKSTSVQKKKLVVVTKEEESKPDNPRSTPPILPDPIINNPLQASQSTISTQSSKTVESCTQSSVETSLESSNELDEILNEIKTQSELKRVKFVQNTVEKNMECDVVTDIKKSTSIAHETQKESKNYVAQYPFNRVHKQYYRFKVQQVQLKENEKVLLVKSPDDTSETQTVILKDQWITTPVLVNNVVNVIGSFIDGKCIIDREHNLLILNPDILIGSTRVSEAHGCPRRSVLQEKFNSGEVSKPAVYGSILHSIFEQALLSKDFSIQILEKHMREAIKQYATELYVSGDSESDAEYRIQQFFSSFKSWAETFFGKGRVVPYMSGFDSETLSVTSVLDIEECIWSPKYGINGYIDATLEVKNHLTDGKRVIPFEFKTGKMYGERGSAKHRAQLILYIVIMADHYGEQLKNGVLYYLNNDISVGVELLRKEMVSLLQLRNLVAGSLMNTTGVESEVYEDVFTPLPPMLKNHYICKRCYVKEACLLYHKVMENGTADTSGVCELFESQTSHLKSHHIEYMSKWLKIIDFESLTLNNFKKEIWRMTGPEREKLGKCFSCMVIAAGSFDSEDPSYPNLYRMEKHADAPELDLSNLLIQPGDYIIVSTEDGHVAITSGILVELGPRQCTIKLRKQLKPPPMNTGKLTLWRIDKTEYAGNMATIRNSVMRLFLAENADERLRKLVVDLEKPVFCKPEYEIQKYKELNSDQQAAIERVLSAKDYCLILGMPGTGKTSTIVYIVKTLISLNKTVLLSSYTNTALDNILLKLMDHKIDFIRIGIKGQVHPKVRPYLLNYQTTTDFEKLGSEIKVVGCTCLGIGHPLFTKIKFDYSIVDEAGQITQPVSLGPIRCASVFVMVGDHNQLPPLVKNDAAKKMGLDVSLFRLLCETHPSAVTSLRYQYRMNADVMLLSSKLVYNNQLLCGTDIIANAKLQLPYYESFKNRRHPFAAENNFSIPSWLIQALDPDNSVIFLNTDQIPAREETVGFQINNPVEIELLKFVVLGFLHCGVSQEDIGVISPFRSQLKFIKEALTLYTQIEMNTVDKYQGIDKSCIVISLVKSNSDGDVGKIMDDIRRINVAFTRAKHKLVIIGSYDTFIKGEQFSKFLKEMKQRNWIFDLPKDAHKMCKIPKFIKANFDFDYEINMDNIDPFISPQKKQQHKIEQTEKKWSPAHKIMSTFLGFSHLSVNKQQAIFNDLVKRPWPR